MAVPTVYIGKQPQPQTELDDIDTPGVVPAQWSPVGDVPLPPSRPGAGEWSAVEDVPLPAQSAGGNPWAAVEDVPLPQGSEVPVRGGASVGADAGTQPPVSAPLDPAVQQAGQESRQFFGREFDLAPSAGLVMRPDDRSWAEKFRGIIPDPFRIPQRTAERFNEGVQTMQQPGVLPKILGGAQAVFSPISGASDALARDPVLQATGDLKKANDAKMLLELTAPGIGLGARNLAPAVAGRTMREAPEIISPAARSAGSGVRFTTAKGSTYEVRPDGSTVRNKAARPDRGHEGQQGPQPPSERTFYVDDEGLDKLGEFQAQGGGKPSIVVKDGHAAIKYVDGKDAGKIERRTITKFHDRPAVGLTPVELWKDGTRVHFGNKITNVEGGPPQLPPPPAGTLPPLEPPVNPLGRPIPPAAPKPAPPEFRDTRGGGVQYHGTSNPSLNPAEGHYTDLNYYGQGMYTTDAVDIAHGYAKRGAKTPEGRNLYQVSEKPGLKLLDGEKPIPPDLAGAIRGSGDDTIVNALGESKNLRELYDNIRDTGTADGLNTYEIQELFDTVRYHLEEAGYNGFSHMGGLKTGKKPHKVNIYFSPEKDLEFSKAAYDDFKAQQAAENLPSTRVIPIAEEVMPGTQLGGAGGGGRPPIDRNASPGEMAEPPKRGLSDAEKEVLGSIGKRPGALAKAGAKAKDMATHPQETADTAVTQIFDNLHPFRVADRELESVRGVGEPTIHELARLTRGSPGGAQHAIKFGTYDFRTGAQNGPGLEEITRGVNADGLRAYMLARRTIELANRGIKTGVNPAAAQRVAQETGGYYEKVFRDVVDYQDRVLNYYKDAGFVSDKGYAAMKQLNQEYVPLQKIVDEIANGTGKNLNVRQIINKIKGSDEYKNVDPLKSIVDNTYTMMTLAERNRALTAFVDRVEKLQGGLPTLARKAGDTGQRLLAGPSGEGEVASNASFIRGRAFHPSDDTMTVWQNGRPVYYKVDPKIAAAAKGLGEAELGTLTKILGTASRGIRHGATSDPFYMISNLIVDQVSAAAQSKTGYKPFLDWLSGVKSMAGKDQSYKDWLKTGGSQSVRYSSEYDPARRDLNMISNNQNVLQRATAPLKHPLEGLTAAKEVIENATKVGEFKRIMGQVEKLRKQFEAEGDAANIGTDIDAKRRAAYQSRNVTQDFQARGASPKLQQLNAITAFLNGNLQGMSRELENIALSGRKQAGNAMKIYGAMIALPSIYTWVANHGDPRYDDAPWFEKDRYWLVLPSDPTKDPIKVRKPFFPGTVIGSGIERGLEQMLGKNPDAFKGFAASVRGTITPPFMPNFVQPMLDQYANKNSFTGAPIIPERDRRVDAPLQKGPGTSEVAKQLGEKFGLSPRIIDHYIQGYGATIGSQGVHALDGLLRPSGSPTKPDTSWKESPFIRRFFARQPGRQPITDFYDNFNKYNELKQSAARLQKQGVPEQAQKYLDQIGENMDGFYKMMNAFSSNIRAIEDDRTMGGAEKREAILSNLRDMVELAKVGNGAYRIGQDQVRERANGLR